MKSQWRIVCIAVLYNILFRTILSLQLLRQCQVFLVFFECREEFKFFNEMDKVFRKQLKADNSVPEMLVPDEPEDYSAESDLNRGQI